MRVQMVADPADYHWSSYRANAFGKVMDLWSSHSEYLKLGSIASVRQFQYRQLFETSMESDVMAYIRQSTQRGLALGSDPNLPIVGLALAAKALTAKLSQVLSA